MLPRHALASACLTLALFALGCGKDKAAAPDDVETTEEILPMASRESEADTAAVLDEPDQEIEAELYEGEARLINLAMKNGSPVAVDVWATQSFKTRPVKLATNVAFGQATEWFTSPVGAPVKAFAVGTNPSAKDDLGALFHPAKGEHITAIIFNDASGKPTNENYWDTSDDPSRANTPDAPATGKGYVVIRAGQLKAHEQAMTETTGGWALRVGDGKESCRRQRVEDLGFSPSLLGGTQPIELDLDPGAQTISFHKARARACTDETKVYEIELDVGADTAELVLLYTADKKSLKHGVFAMPVNKAKPYGTNKALKEKRDAEREAKEAASEAGATRATGATGAN